jgi:hypothetical protein
LKALGDSADEVMPSKSSDATVIVRLHTPFMHSYSRRRIQRHWLGSVALTKVL